MIKKSFFVFVKSYRKKKDKKFKTDLMTSFILLLLLCQFLFNSKLKCNNKKNNTSTLQSLSDSNVIRTHNHLVHKQTIEWGFTQKLVRDMRVFKSLFKKKSVKKLSNFKFKINEIIKLQTLFLTITSLA